MKLAFLSLLFVGCSFWRQSPAVSAAQPSLYMHEYQSLSCQELSERFWVIELQLELLTEGLSSPELKRAIADNPGDEAVAALLELRGRRRAIELVRERKCP